MPEISTQFSNTKLDRYDIKEKLGTGGMARVYRGFDTTLHRPVAIKILHEHLNDDPTFKERFQREARFVASFDHPNIVRIYDFNSIERNDSEINYMVMSYLPGKSLQNVIDTLVETGERLSQARILEIMQDVAQALDYAHMQGMVHRDVKPANILFDEQNHAVLTDFGIARMAQNSKLTQEGTTVGTPAYMSPEQATGEPIDARSDIYSLAIILYELVTGQPPFHDDGSISVLLKHVNEPPPSISKYTKMDDPYLDSVVFRALAKNPQDRYQSALEFIADLKRAFADEEPNALHMAPILDTGLTNQLTTVIDKPISAQIATSANITDETTKNRLHQSPLAILALGLAVIVLIMLFGILRNQEESNDIAAAASLDNPAENTNFDGVNSMTGTLPLYFENTFTANDSLADYWPQAFDVNDLTREILPDEGVYRIESRRSGRAVATIFNTDNLYADFAIEFTATLIAGSSNVSGYGIIFRYVDERNYNVFAVDGEGRYSIWILEDGNWRELREANEEWTVSNNINLLGEANTLYLEVNDNQLLGYINDELLIDLSHDTINNGGIGIYLATPPDGSAIVDISDYAVSEPGQGVSSMTGSDTLSMTGSRSVDMAMTRAAMESAASTSEPTATPAAEATIEAEE